MVLTPGDNHYTTKGTFIYFQNIGPMKSGVTNYHMVYADGVALGEIKWFGRWRKYCFFPKADTVYEEICLGEIAEYCVMITKQHREKKKAEKKNGPLVP